MQTSQPIRQARGAYWALLLGNPLLTISDRSNVIRRGGVYLGEDLTLIINPDSIAQIAALREGAQALVQVINRGVIAKALILKVGDNMVKKRKRLRRLMEKVVDLRDEVVT